MKLVKVLKFMEKKVEVGLSIFLFVFGISKKVSPLKYAMCSPELRNSRIAVKALHFCIQRFELIL